jgi:ABC-2 type transport system ATP-binding protein
MNDAIILKDVQKRFGDKIAVNGLSLNVPAGCIYGFLGPNGAGKTTTLRMILGIFYADSGEVTVLGQNDPTSVKERIGYLPEDRGLYDKMNVADLLTYFAELKGMQRGVARQKAYSLLQEFGLGEWSDKRCQALSKGMAQKVQILRTLIHEPELVILDEPFSGLDPVNRDLMRDMIVDLKNRGRSVVFSTHVMEQAEQICDSVLLIDNGIKVLDGSVADVRSAGGRAVRLDYDGDGSKLATLPGVAGVSDAGKQAEIFLKEGADSQRFLSDLVESGIQVRRFDLTELSLHEIFIRTVNGGIIGGGGEGE